MYMEPQLSKLNGFPYFKISHEPYSSVLKEYNTKFLKHFSQNFQLFQVLGVPLFIFFTQTVYLSTELLDSRSVDNISFMFGAKCIYTHNILPQMKQHQSLLLLLFESRHFV